MKKILTLVLMLLAVMTAGADKVSLTEAQDIAQKFLQSRGISAPAQHHRIRRSGVSDVAKAEPYYLFNAPEAKGFVIVAGNDAYGQILGYSDSGSIDTEDAPEALKAMLGMYERLMLNAPQAAGAPLGEATPVVEPLLGSIVWGQDKPYNDMCPTYTSEGSATKAYYVGCVATAMGQIMKFHNYPAQGSGTKTYTSNIGQMTEDYGATTYQWSRILPSYEGSYTKAEADEVAKLCRQITVSVEMSWMPNGSGAYSQYVETALERYFGYDESVSYVMRRCCPTDRWMQLIKGELDAGRPVFYSASNEDGQGGHAFVADGYDSQDYIHFNWGWHGKSNGYFMVNALNPNDLGIGANGGGYNLDQEIVIGIQPDRKSGEGIPAIYSATRMSGYSIGGTIDQMCYLENQDAKDFDGLLASVLVGVDGSIVKVLKEVPLAIAGVYQNSKSSLVISSLYAKVEGISANVSGVAEGQYQLRFAVRTKTGSAWHVVPQPLGLPAWLDAYVSNGYLSVVTHEMKPQARLLSRVTPDGDIFAGGFAALSMTLENLSSEMCIQKVRVALRPKGEQTVSCVLKDMSDIFNIYDQSTKEITMLASIPSTLAPGEYDVVVYEDKYEQYPFDDSEVGRATLTILPKVDAPVMRAVSQMAWTTNTGLETVRQSDLVVFGVYMRNYGADGTASTLLMLRGEDGEEHPFHMTSKSVTTGGMLLYNFQRRMDLDPGIYTPLLYSVAEDGSMEPIACTEEFANITISDNENIMMECTALNMPEQMQKGTSYECSVDVKALKTFSGKTFYLRLRQFTNTNGEIATMKSGLSMTEGQTQTITFKYKPTVTEGLYMPIIELKVSTSETQSVAGSAVFGGIYRVIDPTGIADVTSEEDSLSAPLYNLSGQRLNAPARGIYIRDGKVRMNR